MSTRKDRVLSRQPISDTADLAETLNSQIYEVEELNGKRHLKTTPVILRDAATGLAAEIFSADRDGLATLGHVLRMAGYQYIFNGVNWDRVRTPNIFHNVTALNAGSTAVWTPGAGLRWRLLGVIITVSQGTTTAAGPMVIRLLDVAADTGIGVTLSTAAMPAAPGALIVLSIPDLKAGVPAAAVATALNVNLSNACATGNISVMVWGTEEP